MTKYFEPEGLLIIDIDDDNLSWLPDRERFLSDLNELIGIFKGSNLPIYAVGRPESSDFPSCFNREGVKVFNFKNDDQYLLPDRLLKALNKNINNELIVVGVNVFAELFSLSDNRIEFILVKELSSFYAEDGKIFKKLISYYFDDVQASLKLVKKSVIKQSYQN